MSFITRCPACGTSFRVVSDQLKISEGWVRCGQCQQVFDATLDLQPWWPDTPAASGVVGSQSSVVAPAFTAASLPDTPAVDVPAEVPPPVVSAPPPPMTTEPEALQESPELAPWEAGDAPSPEAGKMEPQSVLPTSMPALDDGWDKPLFVRQAERRAFWRRPAVRWGLVVLALCLVAGLLGQAAWYWRQAWATESPTARAAWLWVCQVTGCEVGPARRIEHISIDGSAFLRRSVKQYDFEMVLKNSADIELAVPALELTLLDAQEQVLARRVFQPTDWPQPRAVLAPRSEWPVKLELDWQGQEDRPIAGYRAFVFYP